MLPLSTASVVFGLQNLDSDGATVPPASPLRFQHACRGPSPQGYDFPTEVVQLWGGSRELASAVIDRRIDDYLGRAGADMARMFQPQPPYAYSQLQRQREDPARKFIVFVPLEGLGNRFRALISVFLLAMLTER